MSINSSKIMEIVDVGVFNEALLSVVSEGVDVVDEELNVVWMNDKFGSIFGPEAIGKKCYEVYKDDKTQCERCPLRDLSNMSGVRTNVVDGVAGGKTFAINHAPLMLKNGKRAVLEVFRDVSGAVRQKKELEERSAEVDLLNRESGEVDGK